MITVLIYTYKSDAESTLITASHLRKLMPDARVVIMDDAFRPMSRSFTIQIEATGAVVEYSTHNRNGNLIGPEHTIAHANIMKRLAPGPKDILIKLDPDAVILRTNWIADFEADDDAMLAGCFKRSLNYVMGACYAVKGAILPAYVADVMAFPPWVQCFEDFEVSSRIHRLVKGQPSGIHRYDVNGRDGWLLLDYSKAKIENILAEAQVCGGGFFNRKDPIAGEGLITFQRKLTESIVVHPARKEQPCTTSN